MPQRNLGRSVARAAASGGGKAYRARPAVGWYLTMIIIVLAGVSLIVYSRQERLHPKTSSSGEGPTLTSDWHAALGVNLCGTVQKSIPPTPASSLGVTGLRSFGDGLIYIEPGVVSLVKPTLFEGANANLANFAANYPKFKLTSTMIKTPTSPKTYKNGDLCSKLPAHATAAQKKAATGRLVIETWSSPTAVGKIQKVTDPKAVHLSNGEMITVGFITPGQTLTVPPSRGTLISVLGGSTTTTTSPSTSTTTAGSSTTSTTTASGAGSTTTTTTGSTTTTTKASSSTTSTT